MERYLFTLGGKVRCIRCNAMSKRTKQQCMAPAISGKTKCRSHGGKSTGPITDAGRNRCSNAKLLHGRETREIRSMRSLGLQRLRELEDLGRLMGLIKGSKTPGRKG